MNMALREGGRRTTAAAGRRRIRSGLVIAEIALAAVGTYGILAYTVAERRHEIGIRMALGGEAHNVVGMVMGEGARVAGVGLAAGIAGAFALT